MTTLIRLMPLYLFLMTVFFFSNTPLNGQFWGQQTVESPTPEPIYSAASSAFPRPASELLNEDDFYKLKNSFSPSMMEALELWSHAYHSNRVYTTLYLLEKRFNEDPSNNRGMSFTSPPTEEELTTIKLVVEEEMSDIFFLPDEVEEFKRIIERIEYDEIAEEAYRRDRYLTPRRVSGQDEDAEEDSSDDEGDGQP